MKQQHNGYTISTDKSMFELETVHEFLTHSSYWAKGRSLDAVRKSIAHSLCFGLFKGTQQVGFARVVTDYATFAWVCDFFILEEYRGDGLGKWLIEYIVAYPELNGLKNMVLATKDAHEMYRKYGAFKELSVPKKWMRRST